MTDDKCGSTRGHEYLHTEMMTTLDKSVYSFIVRMRLMKITFLTSIFKDKRIRLNYRGGEATTETMSERSSGNGGGATCFLAQGREPIYIKTATDEFLSFARKFEYSSPNSFQLIKEVKSTKMLHTEYAERIVNKVSKPTKLYFS